MDTFFNPQSHHDFTYSTWSSSSIISTSCSAGECVGSWKTTILIHSAGEQINKHQHKPNNTWCIRLFQVECRDDDGCYFLPNKQNKPDGSCHHMPPIQEWLGDEHSHPAAWSACFNVKTSEPQDMPGCTNPQPPNPVPSNQLFLGPLKWCPFHPIPISHSLVQVKCSKTPAPWPAEILIYRLIWCDFQPTHCNHFTTELPSTYADSSIRLTVGASAKMQDSPCQHVLPQWILVLSSHDIQFQLLTNPCLLWCHYPIDHDKNPI